MENRKSAPLCTGSTILGREDLYRVRIGEADINMATIRKIALNVIRLDPSKGSINVKRFLLDRLY